MSKSTWPHAISRGAGIVLLLLFGMVSAASAQGPGFVDGIIRFSDRSLCWYNNTFFNKEVFPIIEQVDAGGNVIGPGFPDANTRLGLYDIPITLPATPGKLRVTCEGLVFEHALTPAEVAAGRADLVLPNHKPAASQFVARLNGQVVRTVPGGSTVSVSVTAGDPDGDPLHFEWGATDGTATNTNTPQATWTLPNSRGLHFLYVLVSDGKGGYEEKQLALSTDGGTLPGVGAARVFLPTLTFAPSAPAALKPSDHTPSGDHFLTYSSLTRYDLSPATGVGGPLDTRISACLYYRDLGVIGGCTADGQPTGAQLTFAAWKALWGFGSPSSNEASAKYANLADLNLQRDMHTLSKTGPRPPSGTGTDVASYVCNYPNTPADPVLSNVLLGNNLVACVAFEYSVTNSPVTGTPYNGGQPFTKFLTFGPTGNLLFSVNLDGRGEKFIPGACVACHGGNSYSGQYGLVPTTDPSLHAQFIPYDLDNYGFSNQVGFRRQDQESQLAALNQFVLQTGPYLPTIELINGWYPTPGSTHHGAFIPPAWQTEAGLYQAVVKPQCRMCHLSLDPATQLAFDTPANFAAFNDLIAERVCGLGAIQRYYTVMPNAKQTFDRFWSSIGGPPGVDEPATLLQYLIAQGTIDTAGNPVTTCALPSWLP